MAQWITSKTKNSRLQNESHVINETLPVKPAFHTNEEVGTVGYSISSQLLVISSVGVVIYC